MSRRAGFWGLLTVALATGFSPTGFAQTNQVLDFKPGEVVVGYRSEADRRASERLYKTTPILNSFNLLGGKSVQKVETTPFRDSALLVKLVMPAGSNALSGDAASQRRLIDDLANQIKKIDPRVKYVYPHYIMGIPDEKPMPINKPQLKKLLSASALPGNGFPNDPEFASGLQWDYQPLPMGMNAVGAWKITTGDRKIVVAVVDTGMLLSHPDVVGSGNLLPGYNFVSDGNGRNPDPTDPNVESHGSHVATIIGVVATNNNLDVAGINWAVSVLPVRALNEAGGGSMGDIADGILWAAGLPVSGAPANATPADIINLSLGANVPCDQMTPVRDAIDKARAAGSVVVVAAGNSSTDIIGTSPASCAGVISVSAADFKGNLSSYSNFGNVSVVAPGGDVDKNGNRMPIIGIGGSETIGFMGTSQAAPHVSAAIALAMSKHEDWRRHPDIIATAIRETAVRMPAGACSHPCGPGQLDAQRLIEFEPSPSKPPLTSSISSPSQAPQKIANIRAASAPGDFSGRWMLGNGSILIIAGDEWAHPSKGTASIETAGQQNILVRYPHQTAVTCSYRVMLMDNGSSLHLAATNPTQPEDFCPSGQLKSAAGGATAASRTTPIKSDAGNFGANEISGRWLMTTGGILIIDKAEWLHPGKGTADLAFESGDRLVVQYPQQTGVKCTYRIFVLDNGKTLQLVPTNNLQPEEYCPSGRLTASN